MRSKRYARPVSGFDHVGQHVLRKGEDDGSRPACSRYAIGTVDIFRDPASILYAGSPFADRTEESGKVDFLEAFAVTVPARHVSNEQDHRCGILESDMDASASVGCARTARHKSNARSSGHLPVRVRHVRYAALLAADGEIDLRRIVKRIENGKEAFARNGKDPVAALNFQLVDENASASPGAGALGHAARVSRALVCRHPRVTAAPPRLPAVGAYVRIPASVGVPSILRLRPATRAQSR